MLTRPPPSEEESKDDISSDKDAPTQMEQTPYSSLGVSFGRQVIWHWNKRKQRIEHGYVIAGWVLCVMEDVS